MFIEKYKTKILKVLQITPANYVINERIKNRLPMFGILMKESLGKSSLIVENSK